MACQQYLFICLPYIHIGRYIIYILNGGCVRRYIIFRLRCPWIWSQIGIYCLWVYVLDALWKMEMFLFWGERLLCRFGVHPYCRSCWVKGARRHLGEMYELLEECCCSSKAELSSVTKSFGVTHRAAKSWWWLYYSQCSTVTLIHLSQEKLKLYFCKLKVLMKCLSISNVI